MSIIDDAPTPPQSNKQSNERKTRSDVIVISSDEEGPPTIAENKVSDLKFTIKRLKRVRVSSRSEAHITDSDLHLGESQSQEGTG